LQLDRPIENLKGDLKVRVIAGSFEQTSKVLSDFKGHLPVDASMKQISIKLGEGKVVSVVGKSSATLIVY
jgi:hypothetical protein